MTGDRRPINPKLAERLAADYPDARVFVDLRGTSSPLAPTDVMRHVIHTFHPEAELPASESERGGLYRSVLHGKRALLLLDDAANADQVQPLIPPASCALLVTSRRRFRATLSLTRFSGGTSVSKIPP